MTEDPSHATDAASTASHSAFRARHFAWLALKWALFLLVMGFVGWHGWRLWHEFNAHTLRFRWGWLALACVVSILAWGPSFWYWRQLLAAIGSQPPWPQVLRAYYCGHLGKYVPGKGMAILIRIALLRPAGVPAAIAAISVTLETLTYMAAGLVTTILLLPSIAGGLPQFRGWADIATQPVWRLAFPGLAVVASLIGLGVLSWISVRLAGRFRSSLSKAEPKAHALGLRTLGTGLLVLLAAWWLQGATLGLTLQALSVEPVDWSDWPLWTGASAVSLVGGFLAFFTAGGLGVREGLLMELLRHHVGAHEAVALAVVFRGVTLIGEVSSSALLYALVRHPSTKRVG